MKDYLVAYIDGAAEPKNPGGNMGIGAFILDKNRKRIFEYSKYIPAEELNGETSNNVAEYLAVIEVFKFFISNNLQNEKIICCGDSKLVINQMSGLWNCNKGIYAKYYYQANELVKKFGNIRFEWIPREKNQLADDLSKREMIKNKCEFKIQKQ